MTLVGKVLLGIFVLFIMAIGGAVLGAFSGWCVGLFYGDAILNIVSQLGITNTTMPQLGAALGFVGSFFRSTVNMKS